MVRTHTSKYKKVGYLKFEHQPLHKLYNVFAPIELSSSDLYTNSLDFKEGKY